MAEAKPAPPLFSELRPLDPRIGPALVVVFATALAAAAVTSLAAAAAQGIPVIRLGPALLIVIAACSRRSLLPAYLAVAFVAECLAPQFGQRTGDVVQAAGDVLEVWLFARAYLALQRRGRDSERLKRLFIGVLLAAGLAPLLAAAAVAGVEAVLQRGVFIEIFVARFLGDATGVVALVPQLLAIRSGDFPTSLGRRSLAEAGLMVGGSLMLTAFCFHYADLPVHFLLFSFLLLATFRLSLAGMFVVVLATSAAAIAFTLLPPVVTSQGEMLSLAHRILVVQLFIAAVVMTTMPVAVLLHHRDRLAQAAAAAADEARRANRSKTDFMAAISHEIRTPMNGILGFAELLRDTELSDEQRRQVSLIGEAGRSLLAISNDILDIASAERGHITLHPAPHSIAALVDGVRSLLQNGARLKGIAMHVEMPDDLPPWVTGDPQRLRQVLVNLTSNAIKFSTAGTVTLRVSRDPAQPARYRFAVSDTGPGMDEAQRRRLFTPFVRLDNVATRRAPGTGLGLAISKRLVEAMPGGRIGVESVVGEGSTFWFEVELPACKGPEEMSGQSSDEVPAIRPLRILVAEDYAVNQMIIQAMLQRGGHEVTCVENGQEAVAAVQAAPYDLVLMDMEMPVMKGLEATRVIRALDGAPGRVPIVALTANAMANEVESCLAAGMNGYLSKPLSRATLEEQLARWSAHRAL